VRPESAAGRLEHGGTTYHFCSEHCLERFRSDPRAFLQPLAPQPSTPQPAVSDTREYTCPMHPEIVQRGPGSCPICGMALEPKTITAGEDANPELEDMSRRFWVSLA